MRLAIISYTVSTKVRLLTILKGQPAVVASERKKMCLLYVAFTEALLW